MLRRVRDARDRFVPRGGNILGGFLALLVTARMSAMYTFLFAGFFSSSCAAGEFPRGSRDEGKRDASTTREIAAFCWKTKGESRLRGLPAADGDFNSDATR